MSLFSTAEFWLSVSFVLFLVLFSKKIYTGISQFLESKIGEIENTLEESEKDYVESSNLLNTRRQDLLNIQSENSDFLKKNEDRYKLSLENSIQEQEEKIKFASNQKKALLKQYKEDFNKKISQSTLESAFNVAKNSSSKGLTKEQHMQLIEKSTQKFASILKQKQS